MIRISQTTTVRVKVNSLHVAAKMTGSLCVALSGDIPCKLAHPISQAFFIRTAEPPFHGLINKVEVQAMFSEVIKIWSTVDILVNNAGIQIDSAFAQMTLQ
jgi:NAD(P)-dependent dehydrogenase (short-subunit alcohol dehydrogenase family)